MGNAILAWDNKVDYENVSITPSSEVSTLPAANLLDPHVAKPWRSIGESPQTLTLDLNDQEPVAIIAMIGVNFGESSTWRIQASTDDPTMATSVFDSGTVATGCDPKYKTMFYRTPGDIAITARYWKITLNDTSLTYLQAGRLFMGPSFIPSRNFSYGWTIGTVDMSRKTRSRGGQTFTDINGSYRIGTLSFDFLTEDDAFDACLEIERVCGIHFDVLIVGKPEAANPSRYTIFGQLAQLSGISEPNFELFTKAFQIEERL